MTTWANASHIVGGEVYYDYLGADNYRFYISVYRDCNSTGAQFDNPLPLTIYTPSGLMVQNVQVPFPGSNNVPVVFNNPCVTPPSNICTEHALYTVDVNLPATPDGYVVSYQRCCRGPNVTNIINPDNTGFTLTCVVPGSGNNFHINSSPRFNDYPPLLLCNNEDLIFDHSATDPDGDQLVYSLVQPHSGATGFAPDPNPVPPPPYADVVWSAGHSTANPLGPGATININPTTGLLTASPNLIGLYVVGVQVQEIRNGVVINTTTRDFLFRVVNCQLQLEALLPLQTELPTFVSYCDGLTVDFVNNSYGGTNYEWDFGVPGVTTDVSTVFAPTFTYPDNGSYTAMLVVNPGWPCTDTAYMDVIVNNEMMVEFTSDDSLCIFGNSFDFVGITDGPAGTTFDWDFGPNASSQTATGQNVNNIEFDITGSIPVTVNAEFNSCVATYTENIYIFPEPIAEMIVPDDISCIGLNIDFGNNSQNSNTYAWDFGVPGTNTDVSPLYEPTFNFPTPGTYTITLVSGSTPNCTDTVTETITLYEPLVVSWTSEDSLCITDNSFNFDGTVSGPAGSVFTWNFGPNASIPTSTDIDVPNVVFDTNGTIPITLTGTFDNCVEAVTQNIYIFQAPSVGFGIQPGLQCAPFTAQFIDSSFAETQIYYDWNFGDGNGSTEQNPSHVFSQVGNYPITLTIRTDAGCIDTLSMLQADIVNVRPSPTAGFSVDPDYTDICHSVIQFTDESVDAEEFFYWFDDTTFFSEEQNPAHLYINDGRHYPVQIVTNQWGCKDTATSELYIEPFTLYAPNTFTPDGDQFNPNFRPIVYLPVSKWHLQIFNRWGELVWETEDENEAWDGTLPNGRVSQDATFIWKLQFVSCEPVNSERLETGHITVLR